MQVIIKNGKCMNEKGKHCAHNGNDSQCMKCVIYAGIPKVAQRKSLLFR